MIKNIIIIPQLYFNIKIKKLYKTVLDPILFFVFEKKLNIQIYKYTNTQIHKYTNTQLHNYFL